MKKILIALAVAADIAAANPASFTPAAQYSAPAVPTAPASQSSGYAAGDCMVRFKGREGRAVNLRNVEHIRFSYDATVAVYSPGRQIDSVSFSSADQAVAFYNFLIDATNACYRLNKQ